MNSKELVELLREARSYVSVAAMEGHKPAADLVDRMTEALAQSRQAVPFLDCRTCAHFTRKAGGCMSVVQCVNGDKFVATRPHQYWEAAPESKA